MLGKVTSFSFKIDEQIINSIKLIIIKKKLTKKGKYRRQWSPEVSEKEIAMNRGFSDKAQKRRVT